MLQVSSCYGALSLSARTSFNVSCCLSSTGGSSELLLRGGVRMSKFCVAAFVGAAASAFHERPGWCDAVGPDWNSPLLLL